MNTSAAIADPLLRHVWPAISMKWVTDWYDDAFYQTTPTRNPRGPVAGTTKGQRGGSYINSPYRLRSAFRTKGDPTEHDPHVGFRCAQDAPPQP